MLSTLTENDYPAFGFLVYSTEVQQDYNFLLNTQNDS